MRLFCVSFLGGCSRTKNGGTSLVLLRLNGLKEQLRWRGNCRIRFAFLFLFFRIFAFFLLFVFDCLHCCRSHVTRAKKVVSKSAFTFGPAFLGFAKRQALLGRRRTSRLHTDTQKICVLVPFSRMRTTLATRVSSAWWRHEQQATTTTFPTCHTLPSRTARRRKVSGCSLVTQRLKNGTTRPGPPSSNTRNYSPPRPCRTPRRRSRSTSRRCTPRSGGSA